MKVLKFGGSSVSSADNMLIVKKIVENQSDQIVVVISAVQGVTDQLQELAMLAADNDRTFFRVYNEIEKKHLDIINSLFEEPVKNKVLQQVNSLFKELSDIINGLFLVNDLTLKVKDRILSYGEQLSSLILSQLIDNCVLINIKNFIKTNSDFGNAKVNFTLTNRLIGYRFKTIKKTAVIPGFIASSDRNEITTLGRGGSDYTAAIVAAALNADRLEIWTDVDGFMTADPKKVKKAFAIESLSYAEAMELSHFGAEVIYTPTIQPVYKKNIEVSVYNTFNPSAKGTTITKHSVSTGSSMIKGISSIDDIALITLQGPGMVGVKGISSRLFGALANKNINIILITQASSEYSITFAIIPEDNEKAVHALEKEFEPEIKLRNELNIQIEKDLSIIAIVGERMKNTPGISANLFSSLGKNGISVIATAQGSSELNISVVIRKESLSKALNVIYEGFFLSHYKELHLYLVGIGKVGSILLNLIKKQQEKLLESHSLKINVIGISNSKKMLIVQDGIDLNNYKEELNTSGEKIDIDLFIQKMKYLNQRNSVFIDCTASENIASRYKNIMESYISVVAANKIACSSEYSLYRDLKKTAKDKNVKFMYETNVGAGLPIISTLNDLIKSGDKVIRIEAVLSGTLNFILNELDEKMPLSKSIKLAIEKGFSEPDPRSDLSGLDVKRKLLILCREANYEININDIKLTPFLPEECFKNSLDDFWRTIKKYDKEYEAKRKKLVEENKKWRYVAELERGKAKIGLKEIDSKHPAYSLEGHNNIILISTDRYHEQPMIIRGYGAGAEVTAAGVFADIIRVVNI
jgi:aspartokinase/homoserine dehydrogenase 1